MKISIIGQVPPQKGGISHYNALLSNALLSQGVNLQNISFRRIFPAWLHPIKNRTDEQGMNLFHGTAQSLFDIPNPLSWSRVIRAITKHQPQLILFHWYTPLLAIPLWWVVRGLRRQNPAAKILAICHNVIPHEKTPLDKPLTRLVMGYVDAIVVHSKKDATIAAAWFPQKKILQLFHPVYDFFAPNTTREQSRIHCGFTKKTLLFFGGVRAYKGLEYLLQALAQIPEKLDLELIIAGEFFGNKEKYLRQISDLGLENKIRILDRYIPNEEVGLLFMGADLIVAPYVSGTQSGALNIAIACRKPIVATDVGGFSEIVIPGKTGFLVPPRNSTELAKAIVEFFKNPPPNFVENMAAVAQAHSWEKLAEKIIQAT